MSHSHLWRPFELEHIANPYAMYHKLREQDPVHKSQTGEWIITRYEDARNILRSGDFHVGNRFEWLKKSIGYLKDKSYDFTGIEQAMKGFILFLNPPDHTRIRKSLHEVLGGKDVDGIVRANLAQLLHDKTGAFDVVHELSSPLPSMTISKILGLPDPDYITLKAHGAVLIKALDLYLSLRDIKKINEAAVAFVLYFEKIIDQKSKNPDEGLISQLIRNNESNRELSDEELLSSCIQLFLAGEETSISLISTLFYQLLKSPDSIQQLREDFSKIPSAIEEVIRYDSPVQVVGRLATKDTLMGGKEIKKNDTLTVCLGSANRDPEQFEQPDELIITRSPNRHLGFGGGAHYCLGDWLAREQARITLETFFQNFRDIELESITPIWNNHLAIRCLTRLPVRLTR